MLENVNLEIVICVTLALGYLAFNILSDGLPNGVATEVQL